ERSDEGRGRTKAAREANHEHSDVGYQPVLAALTARWAGRMTVDADRGRRRNRRDEILEIAVGLFASRGYHGVSMDDIGAAAGVTGPALYHHFAGKEAMLVAALAPVSQGLLEGGRIRVTANPGSPKAALESLVEFHV